MNKEDFPILNRMINGKPLIYFDNAATAQTPSEVISAVEMFEKQHRSNVHRGVHSLSEEATKMYDDSRKTVSEFVHAVVPEEIVFTGGTTESINLAANAWGYKNLKKGDIVLVSEVEHHSNLLPWQEIAKRNGCEINYIPLKTDGTLDIRSVKTDWDKVKLVAFAHVSNVLGVVNDVREIRKYIRKRVKNDMPRILIDAAQSVPHMPINVQKLGVDFMAFSGHKMCGPMGIGVLWINREVFNELDVYKTGGGMIREVYYDSEPVYANVPEKFEAGTPNVSGAVGLAVACKYLQKIGLEEIHKHEKQLTEYLITKLKSRDDIDLYGCENMDVKSGVVAFNLKNVPSHDLATIFDTEGIAIRSGHHCVMPWHTKQKVTTTARISFYFYNTIEEIEHVIVALDKAKKILSK